MIGLVTIQRLLRCQIVCRAQDILVVLQSERCLVPDQPGEPHVEQFHRALLIEKAIRRFNIAVHQPHFVSVIESSGNLCDVVG